MFLFYNKWWISFILTDIILHLFLLVYVFLILKTSVWSPTSLRNSCEFSSQKSIVLVTHLHFWQQLLLFMGSRVRKELQNKSKHTSFQFNIINIRNLCCLTLALHYFFFHMMFRQFYKDFLISEVAHYNVREEFAYVDYSMNTSADWIVCIVSTFGTGIPLTRTKFTRSHGDCQKRELGNFYEINVS